MDLFSLNSNEQNVLIASILGDGEITKRYPGSRRKNNSYREHFSIQQLEYRICSLLLFTLINLILYFFPHRYLC
ncbi:hypothetical protein BBI08_13495 [Planococcus halocryophilus]|uniref:Homing endonuclease LAGLIDADG domain-containing protein n=1 Tax=Planococcus halocryophilus TaxID=1215089 RepID=A0A1C7DU47_9BACL|nr:hypothetical protein BBI08_13495 [Planococcus halocryophilus]